MPLNIQCSHCSATLRLRDDSYLGKKVRCPKCQEIFTVHSPSKQKLNPQRQQFPSSRNESEDLYLDDVDDDLIDDWEDDNWDDFEETDSLPPRSKKRPSKKKRRKRKTLDLDDQYERIRRNIRAISFIYAFFGGLFALSGLALMQDPDERTFGIGMLVFFSFASFSGISILTRQAWGIPCCKVVSAIYLLVIPIGTLLGAYFLMNVGYVEDEFT
ncbi:zinc-ribbon domain-containing protein [Planctomicrobium sp.]|nr:zinc-ribbon domain-containing protein [Planctomicrobium sp.]MDB4733084.1 zinc-ribbon domain-containing protein [Planctomicrobium sp.]